MFMKCLESDLKKIFGLKKVNFTDLSFGCEQDVLYCNIDADKTSLRRGKEYARVMGSIALASPIGKLKYGFLRKQYDLSDKEIKKRFFLLGQEINESFPTYDRIFTKCSLNFYYIYSHEYNPAAKAKGINLNTKEK